MKKQFSPKVPHTYLARIKVVGVGGGGGNAISRMADDIGVRGIDFIAINTDAQDLDYCVAKKKIYIGKNLTRGLGTGMNPELGRQAAEENRSEIVEALKGADLVFVTAGLGGGTGSGACPVIAEAARELGALTIAVVTKPFLFEGVQRARIAQDAFGKLKEKVDTIITVPNDRIFALIRKDTPIMRAFEYIDDVLKNAIQGIAEVIALPGLVNVDFADVKTIMAGAGPALVGVGIGAGQERAAHAVTEAVSSPLLEISIDGAKGILFTVAGGRDMRMTEVHEVAKAIGGAIDPAAKIIFGAYYDRKLARGQLKVTVVATGFNGGVIREPEQVTPTLFSRKETEERPSYSHELAGENATPPSASKQNGGKKEPPRKQKEDAADKWAVPTFLRRGKRPER